MSTDNLSRFSVSSYSLHRTLGAAYRDLPGDDGSRPCIRPQGAMTLLELPGCLAAHGYHTFEISHPHLPSRDPGYLGELRAAIAEAGVTLLSVLVEAGDLTSVEFGNWEGPSKYTDLATVYRYAETCHAKCAFLSEYVPDAEDYGKCLELARENGFSGPYTLIYNSSGRDEWKGLDIERELVLSSLH